MSDIYAPKRARVAALLRQWQQGTVTLTRTTEAASEPETPWRPGAETLDVYTLDAVVKGVEEQYIDGTTVVASDLMVVVAPFAIEPRMLDILTVDGEAKVIKRIAQVPAAGLPARFNIFVAS